MNTYTEKDIMDLIQNITLYEFREGNALYQLNSRSYQKLDPLKKTFFYINVNGWDSLFEVAVMYEIITGDLSGEDVYNKFEASGEHFHMLKNKVISVSHLIKDIPLEEVPMYISALPEIAAWRLRIGK